MEGGLTMRDCNIQKNYIEQDSLGIYVTGANLDLTNTKFLNNP